jgi:hypothetical protein
MPKFAQQTLQKLFKLLACVLFCLALQGCLGVIVGNTVDVAIEVAKVPFKVGGAVIDVVSGGEKKDGDSSHQHDSSEGNSHHHGGDHD